jgi:dienelactone hydrolase
VKTRRVTIEPNANALRATLPIAVVLASLLAASALASDEVVQVPAPTGSYRVGTRVLSLIDANRPDPFLNDGSKRELLLRFWYPISPGQSCTSAPYTSPRVWSYLSQLTGLRLSPVRTNSCQDATILPGPHAVVVFSPGYTGMFTDSTFLFEELASRGYVVTSIAHTYETTAVEFPEGRVATSIFGSYLAAAGMRSDFSSVSRAFSVRLADLSFVLDELSRLNQVRSGPFGGALDMSRIAVMGHSLGGVAAMTALESEHRFAAAVTIDPILFNVPVRETTKPVLILAAGRERWNSRECELWTRLRGPRLAVNLKGAGHLTPSDAVWLFQGIPGLAEEAGTEEPAKTVAAIRSYVTAFLDANLRGKIPSPLLTRTSSDFSDVTATVSKQELCPGSKTH